MVYFLTPTSPKKNKIVLFKPAIKALQFTYKLHTVEKPSALLVIYVLFLCLHYTKLGFYSMPYIIVNEHWRHSAELCTADVIRMQRIKTNLT